MGLRGGRCYRSELGVMWESLDILLAESILSEYPRGMEFYLALGYLC